MKSVKYMLLLVLFTSQALYGVQNKSEDLQNTSLIEGQKHHFATITHDAFMIEQQIRNILSSYSTITFSKIAESPYPINDIESLLITFQQFSELFKQYQQLSALALNRIDRTINEKYKNAPLPLLKKLKRNLAHWQYWNSKQNLHIHNLRVYPIPLSRNSGLHRHRSHQALFQQMSAESILEEGFSRALLNWTTHLIPTITMWRNTLDEIKSLRDVNSQDQVTFHAQVRQLFTQLKKEDEHDLHTRNTEMLYLLYKSFEKRSFALWMSKVAEYIENNTLEHPILDLPITLGSNCQKTNGAFLLETTLLKIDTKTLQFFKPFWSSQTTFQIQCEKGSWAKSLLKGKKSIHKFAYKKETETLVYRTNYHSDFEDDRLYKTIFSLIHR